RSRGAFACRAPCPVGHRNELRRERLEPLDRLPQPRFRVVGLGREELERHPDAAADVGAARKAELVHYAISAFAFVSPGPAISRRRSCASHSLTVRPGAAAARRSKSRLAVSSRPVSVSQSSIWRSEKPRRTCAC